MIIKYYEAELIKDRRSAIKQVLFLFPVIIYFFTIIFFSSTGYIIESAINQWSFFWLNIIIALEIGLIDKREKKETQYKMIVSTLSNLGNFEYARIMHGITIMFFFALYFGVITVICSFFITAHISIVSCLIAIAGITLSSLWLIPLYTWICRKTNIYITLLISFLGAFFAPKVGTIYGNLFPYNWATEFSVYWIRLKVNGLPLSGNQNHLEYWTIFASIMLTVILSIFCKYSFNKMEVK